MKAIQKNVTDFNPINNTGTELDRHMNAIHTNVTDFNPINNTGIELDRHMKAIQKKSKSALRPSSIKRSSRLVGG